MPQEATIISLMRHSVATHNEAASKIRGSHDIIYEDEKYADAPLTAYGIDLARQRRPIIHSLVPLPGAILCSPLKRAVQTALEVSPLPPGVPLIVTALCREAYGMHPCDRHSPREELRQLFGDKVDLSAMSDRDYDWKQDERESVDSLTSRALELIHHALHFCHEREIEHIMIVSHGVFIEYLASCLLTRVRYPGVDYSGGRVMNCDINTFCFHAHRATDTCRDDKRILDPIYYMDTNMVNAAANAGVSLKGIANAATLWGSAEEADRENAAMLWESAEEASRYQEENPRYTMSQECFANFAFRRSSIYVRSLWKPLAHVLSTEPYGLVPINSFLYFLIRWGGEPSRSPAQMRTAMEKSLQRAIEPASVEPIMQELRAAGGMLSDGTRFAWNESEGLGQALRFFAAAALLGENF